MERSIPYRLVFFFVIICIRRIQVVSDSFYIAKILIQGNLNWMQSREASLKSPVWRGRENEIRPFGNPKASDSANLDSTAEV